MAGQLAGPRHGRRVSLLGGGRPHKIQTPDGAEERKEHSSQEGREAEVDTDGRHAGHRARAVTWRHFLESLQQFTTLEVTSSQKSIKAFYCDDKFI